MSDDVISDLEALKSDPYAPIACFFEELDAGIAEIERLRQLIHDCYHSVEDDGIAIERMYRFSRKENGPEK